MARTLNPFESRGLARRIGNVNDERATRLVNLATIAGAAITAASMIFGVLTYRRGVHVQHEAAAVGILQEFLKLSIEHPQLASGKGSQPDDPQYVWFTTHVLFTSETLWSLMGQDRQWENTIAFIVRPHQATGTGRAALQRLRARFRGLPQETVPETQVR